jgi:hypothetical protein
VEEQVMDAYSFMVQQRTFDIHGYALNPSTAASGSQPVVGSLADAETNGYSAIDAIRPSRSTRREQKRKRGGKGDAGVVDGDDAYMGPWAAYESEKVAEIIEDDPEADEEWQVEKKRREEAKEAAQEKMKEAKVEKSIFHGKELTDYAGRTYMHIPTDTDVKLNPSDGATPPNAYLPERCVHTWVSLGFRLRDQADNVDWSQQGCLAYQAIPQEWSFAPQWKHGHKDQGKLKSACTWDTAHTSSCGTSTTRATVCELSSVIHKPSRMFPSTTADPSSSRLPTIDTSNSGIPKLVNVSKSFRMARSQMSSSTTRTAISKTSLWPVCRTRRLSRYVVSYTTLGRIKADPS